MLARGTSVEAELQLQGPQQIKWRYEPLMKDKKLANAGCMGGGKQNENADL